MIIDGIDARSIVEKSIRDGSVSRPVSLQATLEQDERQELSDTILAARRRMAERQSHEHQHDRIRGMAAPGHINVIDGKSAALVAASSIRQGVAEMRGIQLTPCAYGMVDRLISKPYRASAQRKWTRDSMRVHRSFHRLLQTLSQATNEN